MIASEFNANEWLAKYHGSLRWIGETWHVWDGTLPAEVMSQMYRSCFGTWTDAMRAIKRAAWSAWHKGWRPA